MPACSPQLLDARAPTSPADLASLPLLSLETRPEACDQWFARHQVSVSGYSGMMLDQFSTATQAAVAGLGVALLPEIFIRRELDDGDLVIAMDLPTRNEAAYYLVWPQERSDYAPLVALREWLGQNNRARRAEIA